MEKLKEATKEVEMFWDWGTAYDFFISMWVLHDPTDFGLRAAWAAGMRSRIPAAERETLEQLNIIHSSSVFHWIYSLPSPKDGRTVLRTLEAIPAEDRLPTVALGPEVSGETEAIYRSVAQKGSWDETDLEELRNCEECAKMEKHKGGSLETNLDLWANVEETGERMLQAYQAYFDVFFSEEENRIRPALEKAIAHAQELAEKMEFTDLMEELSQGVRLDIESRNAEAVLAPSYWGSPLLVFGKVKEDRDIFFFGARPPEDSLVPGELVPDALIRTLKALSDPTRLRILRYLAAEPLTPTQLASRLRLRSSTVVHHLSSLRLATLVQFTSSERKEQRYYSARMETIHERCDLLKGFLSGDELFEDEALD